MNYEAEANAITNKIWLASLSLECLTLLKKDIAQALQRAVEEERERCAVVAEKYRFLYFYDDPNGCGDYVCNICGFSFKAIWKKGVPLPPFKTFHEGCLIETIRNQGRE